MSNKPLNPKGTRDFNPLTLKRRRYIIDIIRSTFESFGYNEIETPSIERRSTLYHKYGMNWKIVWLKVLIVSIFW